MNINLRRSNKFTRAHIKIQSIGIPFTELQVLFIIKLLFHGFSSEMSNKHLIELREFTSQNINSNTINTITTTINILFKQFLNLLHYHAFTKAIPF
jgi:hypothetical protein